jgi:hypothetical protein
MIVTRFMELRKRRGLMIALVSVTIGIPTLFLAVRLLLHAIAPNTYGPAGGYNVYSGLSAGVLYVFGFIVAATLGCTAGSVDLTEGMFRHLVVTGRSRLALYLARIPAGLAIIVPLVAVGFAIVCSVCVLAAPSKVSYDGVNLPSGLSRTAFVNWAADNPGTALCNFNYTGGGDIPNVQCTNGPNGSAAMVTTPSPQGPPVPSAAQLKAAAVEVAGQNYASHSDDFRYPPGSLMIRTGLWIELEAVVGFIVGLGLSSLLGQRTVAVIFMIVLEIVLTPILSRVHLTHLENLQRAVVGLATDHLEPGALPLAFGGGGPSGRAGVLLPESRTVAVCVIVAWLVGWTVLGAWRMTRRDA